MKELKGKVAVITGGGSGLGRELALACARRGMKLLLADVDEPGMAETARLAGAARGGTEIDTMRVDVSKLEQVEALAQRAKTHFGGAYLLFNNAGVSCGGPLWEHTVADWQWVLGVNLQGVAWGIKAFVPLLLEQGEGHIVNTASAAGWLNAPGGGIYNASKSAVVSLSETLFFDLQDVGADRIGVTVLSPAYFPTPIVDSARNRPAELSETAPMSEARRRRDELIRYAVERGRIPAAEIAEMTLVAVENNQFYVFPHKKIKALIKARAEAADRELAAFDSLSGR